MNVNIALEFHVMNVLLMDINGYVKNAPIPHLHKNNAK